MSIDLSVVVAVYNEDPRNLEMLLARLAQSIEPTGLSYEVVFVNDGSTPETSAALTRLTLARNFIKLLVFSRNFGQQAAITAGLDYSEGRAIVNIDSDGQDPPELIPEMIKLWREGYEVVYAQRSSRRDRLGKRLSAFLFYRILSAVSSVKIPWDTGDFRLMDRKVIDALAAMPEHTRFVRGQVPWLGFKQIGIPIERGARALGESTYTLKRLLALAMDGLLTFSVMPLYMIPVIGALLFATGLIGLLVALVLGLSGQHALLALLLLSGLSTFCGTQIICTGLVAIYLAKVLEEVRARPVYIVSQCVGKPFDNSSNATQQYARSSSTPEQKGFTNY